MVRGLKAWHKKYNYINSRTLQKHVIGNKVKNLFDYCRVINRKVHKGNAKNAKDDSGMGRESITNYFIEHR